MDRAERTAFVFAGGGSLGAIEAGMLRELVASGVMPDMVVGASAGPSMRRSLPAIRMWTAPRGSKRCGAACGVPR